MIDIYLKKEIYFPKGSFWYIDHFNDEGWLSSDLIGVLRGNPRNVVISPNEISQWFRALRNASFDAVKSQGKTLIAIKIYITQKPASAIKKI